MDNQTYERTVLVITEFDTEDVITTSGESAQDPLPYDPYEGMII